MIGVICGQGLKWDLRKTYEKACVSHLNGLSPTYQPMYCTVTVILGTKNCLRKSPAKMRKMHIFQRTITKDNGPEGTPYCKDGLLAGPRSYTLIHPAAKPPHRL